MQADTSLKVNQPYRKMEQLLNALEGSVKGDQQSWRMTILRAMCSRRILQSAEQ